MINSLEYTLDFWNENKRYKIHHNSVHCISLPEGSAVDGFLPIENYGFSYFEKWFTEEKLISKRTYKLLVNYFHTYFPALPIVDITEVNWDHLIVGRSGESAESYNIYSDGSCAVHSSKTGRWAFVVIDSREGIVHEDGLTVQNTTNGEMELHGLYESLKYANERLTDSKVNIYCDSSYVVNGYNSWCSGWRGKGWKKANNTPVKYENIWKEIDKIRSQNIDVQWVKGHSDSKWNNYVDELTRKY